MIITETVWTAEHSYPILTLLQLVPLAGFAALFWMRNRTRIVRFSILVTVLEMLLAIDLWLNFDLQNSGTMQFAEQINLWGPLVYHAGVDGMSVLFILLTALLGILVMLYGHIIPLERPERFPYMLLAVESVLMSLFTTLDLLWFALMSALELSLIAYMLWRWATSPERDLALIRYGQFMITAMLLLLAGILLIGWNYTQITANPWTFNLLELSAVAVDKSIHSIVFFLLFYGLAIRIPLFPFHGWLPLAAEHGTVAIAPVLLIGLKVGVYALIRFVLPLLPEAVIQWHQFIVAFAVVGVFYAAVMAMMQVNLRRLLSFAVVSHTSVLIIGLFSLNLMAFEGAVLLSANYGLAIAGLLFMSGFVFWRTRTLLLKKLGGLFDILPLIGIGFFISGLSIVGMPGTPGFDAAHLILEASVHRFGALVTIAAALGNVVAAGFLLWAFQKAFLTAKSGSSWDLRKIYRASLAEQLLAAAFIFILLTTGFYSEPWISLLEGSMQELGQIYATYH